MPFCTFRISSMRKKSLKGLSSTNPRRELRMPSMRRRRRLLKIESSVSNESKKRRRRLNQCRKWRPRVSPKHLNRVKQVVAGDAVVGDVRVGRNPKRRLLRRRQSASSLTYQIHHSSPAILRLSALLMKKSRQLMARCSRMPDYKSAYSTKSTLSNSTWKMIIGMLKSARCYRVDSATTRLNELTMVRLRLRQPSEKRDTYKKRILPVSMTTLFLTFLGLEALSG